MPIGTWGSVLLTRQALQGSKWVDSVDAEGDQIRWRARARARDLDGITRLVEVTAPSRGKAEKALQEKLRQRFKGGASSISGDTLVLDLLEVWEEQLEDRDLAPRTLQDYSASVRRYLRPQFAGIRLQECTPLFIEGVFRRVHRQHGPGAVKMLRAILMQIMQIGVRHGALIANPVRDAEAPKRRAVRQPRSLTVQEEAQLLEVLRSERWTTHYDLADPLRFMLATGVRLGEMCGVRWVDIDLQTGVVQICGTVQRITGQGIIRKPETKSRSGMRSLKLPSWAVEMIKDRQDCHVERFGVAPDPADYVFTAPAGGVIDPANTQRLMRRIFAECGFEGVTSHTLRKTVATKLDGAGLSAREIADVLGHSQISMTLNAYLGRNVAGQRAADIL